MRHFSLLISAALVVGCASTVDPPSVGQSESTALATAPEADASEEVDIPAITVPAPEQPPTTVEVVYAEAADPTVVKIPAIDVEAPIIALGLRDDGSIEVPEDADDTGWWQDGPEPGEAGPAVILGHVDSYTGPAVFFRLDELTAGDEITIDRADGSSVTYAVDRIEQYSKDEFPTEAVYGSTDEPVLRLVTCGGLFDRDVRSYTDNLIVFATYVA